MTACDATILQTLALLIVMALCVLLLVTVFDD
jgi:hypothetical protein